MQLYAEGLDGHRAVFAEPVGEPCERLPGPAARIEDADGLAAAVVAGWHVDQSGDKVHDVRRRRVEAPFCESCESHFNSPSWGSASGPTAIPVHETGPFPGPDRYERPATAGIGPRFVDSGDLARLDWLWCSGDGKSVQGSPPLLRCQESLAWHSGPEICSPSRNRPAQGYIRRGRGSPERPDKLLPRSLHGRSGHGQRALESAAPGGSFSDRVHELRSSGRRPR